MHKVVISFETWGTSTIHNKFPFLPLYKKMYPPGKKVCFKHPGMIRTKSGQTSSMDTWLPTNCFRPTMKSLLGESNSDQP